MDDSGFVLAVVYQEYVHYFAEIQLICTHNTLFIVHHHTTEPENNSRVVSYPLHNIVQLPVATKCAPIYFAKFSLSSVVLDELE